MNPTYVEEHELNYTFNGLIGGIFKPNYVVVYAINGEGKWELVNQLFKADLNSNLLNVLSAYMEQTK